MNYPWSKTVLPIAAIFAFRMLGLFLLIPVFSVYAINLQNATPILIGIALGVYGLAQGVFQIPFGMLSDRFGRKPIIGFGLTLFIVGSLIGAYSNTIYEIIAARVIQGMGAIGSVLIALLADLTPDKQRTKAMAVIGATIGASFSIAMIISPALSSYYGLSGIFYLTAGLASTGLILLYKVIPTPRMCFQTNNESKTILLKKIIQNKQLQKLNLGIFCQHFILTATFFPLPYILKNNIEQHHLTQQWHFYLPIMIGAFLLMLPFLGFAEKKGHLKPIFLGSILFISLSQLLLSLFHLNFIILCQLVLIFFIAFNILEASLPALISKQAHPATKGTAMGVYSTCQFLGIFAGGATAGLIFQCFGTAAIFLANSGIALVWLYSACSMNTKTILNYLSLPIHALKPVHQQIVCNELSKLRGVQEVNLSQQDQVIYLVVNKALYAQKSAEDIMTQYMSL